MPIASVSGAHNVCLAGFVCVHVCSVRYPSSIISSFRLIYLTNFVHRNLLSRTHNRSSAVKHACSKIHRRWKKHQPKQKSLTIIELIVCVCSSFFLLFQRVRICRNSSSAWKRRRCSSGRHTANANICVWRSRKKKICANVFLHAAVCACCFRIDCWSSASNERHSMVGQENRIHTTSADMHSQCILYINIVGHIFVFETSENK